MWIEWENVPVADQRSQGGEVVRSYGEGEGNDTELKETKGVRNWKIEWDQTNQFD